MELFFRTVLAGFLSGVFLRSFNDFGVLFILFLFLLAGSFCVWYIARGEKRALFVAVFAVATALGVMRFDMAYGGAESPVLARAVGTSVSLEGVVSAEPDTRDDRVLLAVSADALVLPDGRYPVSAGVLVTVAQYPEWKYGDRVLVSGVLEYPKNFENEQGREFDYVSYLKKDGISYRMFARTARITGEGEGSAVKEALFSFKRKFLSALSLLFPEPHASLLGGLLVGAKESLGKELLDDFRAVGIVHIVVLSGYNVTIVAEAIMRSMGFLPRVWALSAGALSIVAFAVMTGGGATIVRASVMALLVLLARATGRTYDITRALFLAGFLMVFVDPDILVFDISFQLSFLATLGLLYGPPILEKYVSFIPARFHLRDFALATIATQIFVLPLLLLNMGELSLTALPVNLLVLPAIPLTMLLGFLAGVAGMIAGSATLALAFPAYILLSYALLVVNVFSALPFASVGIAFFPVWLAILFYGAYAFVIMANENKSSMVSQERTGS